MHAQLKQNKKAIDGEYKFDKTKLADKDNAYPKDCPYSTPPIASPL